MFSYNEDVTESDIQQMHAIDQYQAPVINTIKTTPTKIFFPLLIITGISILGLRWLLK